jgi:hypothetical protein
MENKRSELGILAMILVFGMAFVGCDLDDKIDSALNGTWVNTPNSSQTYQYVLKMNNGSWEGSYTDLPISNGGTYSGPYGKGTYTASDGTYKSKTTRFYGSYISAVYPGSQTESGWITDSQYYSAIESYYRQLGYYTEDQINTMMYSYRNPEAWTTTYSVNGKTLTLTSKRTSDEYTSTTTYTKR